jgi:uncharacterized protein YbjT (DUF2867 family)
MAAARPIAVLGAGGLIGQAIASDLQQRGLAVRAVARRFTRMQAAMLREPVLSSLTSLDEEALLLLLADVDLVVNCLGVLQGGQSDEVHRAFVARLAACCARAPQRLLIHLSVPGNPQDDRTAFSLTKREGERAIAASDAPYLILRPGFVIAAAAYGGGALIRALAAWPVRLPAREGGAVFTATAMADICQTVALAISRWRGGETHWRKTWDVMETSPGTVDGIVELFRRHGGGPPPLLRLPGWSMVPGIAAGEAVALLGWRPPMRRTAIAEMRRGVTGDPTAWIADTGIVPQSAEQAVAATPVTVQETWFARLYLLKGVALATLVLFWCVSGVIALTVAFHPARAMLLAHGFSFSLAHAVTIVSSLIDISVGLAIAVRRTSRIGLAAGILVSLGYMAGAAVLTPDIWFEPLGALVKTWPAIILMLFCLALFDDRA